MLTKIILLKQLAVVKCLK